MMKYVGIFADSDGGFSHCHDSDFPEWKLIWGTLGSGLTVLAGLMMIVDGPDRTKGMLLMGFGCLMWSCVHVLHRDKRLERQNRMRRNQQRNEVPPC